jgi:hypothetical protein
MIISNTFTDFFNFALLRLPIKNFSAAFRPRLNFRNFWSRDTKAMAKDKKVHIEVAYSAQRQ